LAGCGKLNGTKSDNAGRRRWKRYQVQHAQAAPGPSTDAAHAAQDEWAQLYAARTWRGWHTGKGGGGGTTWDVCMDGHTGKWMPVSPELAELSVGTVDTSVGLLVCGVTHASQRAGHSLRTCLRRAATCWI